MQLLSAFLLVFTLVWMLHCCGSIVGDVVVAQNITVDLSGNGDYRSVQAAINSVPENNDQWIRIHLRKGFYNEKVMVNSRKEYILLEGEGPRETVIQWGDHEEASSDHRMNLDSSTTKVDTWGSASFTALASNFVARSISFKNTYNDKGDQPRAQAVAALLSGDKMSFHHCSFIGLQDTLCDFRGRHYFRRCYIRGSVDFVFGVAQSMYEKCQLKVVGRVGHGYITAHGRNNLNDTSGYVFKYSTIVGTRKAYLGRAWRDYSRVLFYRTSMAAIVVPQGWDAWNAKNKGNQTTYAEKDCFGHGSANSGRVPWEKNLTDKEWKTFISHKFIDAEGWRKHQP